MFCFAKCLASTTQLLYPLAQIIELISVLYSISDNSLSPCLQTTLISPPIFVHDALLPIQWRHLHHQVALWQLVLSPVDQDRMELKRAHDETNLSLRLCNVRSYNLWLVSGRRKEIRQAGHSSSPKFSQHQSDCLGQEKEITCKRAKPSKLMIYFSKKATGPFLMFMPNQVSAKTRNGYVSHVTIADAHEACVC